ncbi:baseplate wedge subunit [uncultured Caudovirales phage]|uniref:Baseplate wedge subunit n=1 Tax=uncultured Caudovirales phage TaxID=2100421 RepID=A0A6J7WWD8_9CAUD|nr:baseplate wedge subunit [uncultured Caudovirales phage]
MSYFANFPKIDYFNSESRNIILKAAIIADVFNKANVFYKYRIPEGYRPDNVAEEVYNNPTLDWVVFFSNNVIDPYYEWPLSQRSFDEYMTKKYSKTLYELQSEIHHYKYTGIGGESDEDIARKSWTMTPTSHAALGPTGTAGWTPVYTYDYESEINDEKRVISLLAPLYLPKIINELSKIFNK